MEIYVMWEAFQTHILKILPKPGPELLKAIEGPQYPSIRFNSGKATLGKNNPGVPVPWEPRALQLMDSRPFYLDPEWHTGAYYVQESNSMFLGPIIRTIIDLSEKYTSLKVLDLCAAPGGKSTHLLDLLPSRTLLVANEVLPKRNAILRENLIRWGKPNVIVTQNEPADFLPLANYFDIVLVDAPCSGEGLFRKDKEAIKEWSPEQVQVCANRQHHILDTAQHLVKPGGFLVYSTCTYEPSENEEQVAYLLQQGFESVPVDISSYPQIETGSIPHTYRFYPHKTAGSGFFAACLKKTEISQPANEAVPPKRKKRSLEMNRFYWKEQDRWIIESGNYDIIQTPLALYAFPINKTFTLFQLNEILHITYFGVELGEWKKDFLVPAHALALSVLASNNIPRLELDDDQAIDYLRKLPLRVDYSSTDLGWNLVCHNHFPLGWVKILPDRINNYLPNNWRILH